MGSVLRQKIHSTVVLGALWADNGLNQHIKLAFRSNSIMPAGKLSVP